MKRRKQMRNEKHPDPAASNASASESKNNNKKDKKSKVKIIIGIVAVLLVLIVAVSISKSGNKNQEKIPAASEMYPIGEDMGYDSDDNDDSNECSYTIDPYEVIQEIVVDINDNKAYIKFDTSYNKEKDGIKLIYSGDTDPYDGNGLLVKLPDGTNYNVSYDVDILSFNSTGKVTVTPSASNEIVFTKPSATFDAITCDYLTDPSKIKDSDYKLLKEHANKVYAEASEKTDNGKYYKTYFSMQNSTGVEYGRIEFMYSYVHEGQTYYQSVAFEELKITENGDLCNISYTKEKGIKLIDLIDIDNYQNSKYVEVKR